MQVRTFQGANTKEVLAQVKAEMGSDAVILGSREFRQNNKRCFEVTAGIERKETQQVMEYQSSTSSHSSSMAAPSGFEEWHKDWNRFKEHVYALMQPALNWEKISPRQRIALEYLQNEGVENDVVVELYHKLTLPKYDGSLLAALTDTVPIQAEESDFWNQHIHILVGPYGVGKTTSALRLALALRDQKPEAKVAFINTDSTRGSGRLILKYFCELSGFLCLEAADKNSLVEAIKTTIDYDHVFVDFQSLPKGETLMKKFENFGLAQVKQNISCHLCLSPQYSSAQLDSYIEQYKCHVPTSILWTKLDEATHFGAMVNMSARTKLPISALSYGAELSETLCLAQASMVWRVLLKHQLPTK